MARSIVTGWHIGLLDRDATIETLAAHVDDLVRGPTTPMESAGGAMAAMFRDYPGPR